MKLMSGEAFRGRSSCRYLISFPSRCYPALLLSADRALGWILENLERIDNSTPAPIVIVVTRAYLPRVSTPSAHRKPSIY